MSPVASREEEGELVRACIEGKDAAWERLVRDYSGGALAGVKAALRQRGHGSDPALEEELLADSFEILAAEGGATLRSFRGESGLATFISVVATRRAFRVLRDRLRHGKAVDRKGEQEKRAPRTGEPDPAQNVQAAERASLMVETIAELSGSDKLLLTLFYLDGRSYKDIAAVTGLAVTGVGTKIARARARLKERLARRGVSTDGSDPDI
ncbi:sigma-70 family RNA polymerase sigma factor [bacterium]|nr:sigma-70 family RNA polymerase sigma factor [bacterium]